MASALTLDHLWVLLCAILVFVMQAGFLCLEAGATRNKNSINTALKNISDFGIAMLGFWAIGYGLMLGVSKLGWFGTSGFLFVADTPADGTWFIFQAAFCGTALTIVSGAVAERLKFSMYLLISGLGAVCIYPMVGHWVWNPNGWLSQLGFVDFAGSTVVHSLGGTIALAVIIVLGARAGRFQDDGSVREFNGSNPPLALLGTLFLCFGWFGFNGGSSGAFDEKVPLILTNTLLAAASGLVVSLVVGYVVYRRPHVYKTMNGLLGGLVAVTASCFAVTHYEAIIIGAVGGVVVLFSEHLLERLLLDDAVGAISVHLGAGIWGTLAVGLFGSPDVLGTGLDSDRQIVIQILGILVCFVAVFSVSLLLAYLANKVWGIRVSRAAEEAGLNVAEHRANDDVEDLLKIMREQAQSRDLSALARAAQDPFTQAGVIGLHYNNLVWSLRESIKETEGVLQQVLPTGVAERLKRGASVSDSYEEVTIIFIDIVGFTRLANNIVARRVVSLLNDIFGRFDEQATRFDVEKVKTIGDSYMAVSGLQDPTVNHAENAVRMALAAIDQIALFNVENRFDLNVRIGINSGPIIAGVVGKSRFMYDMWGDAVNVASRMESEGIEGKVQLSESTYDLVRKVPDLRFTSRGEINIKGKGMVETWLVENLAKSEPPNES